MEWRMGMAGYSLCWKQAMLLLLPLPFVHIPALVFASQRRASWLLHSWQSSSRPCRCMQQSHPCAHKTHEYTLHKSNGSVVAVSARLMSLYCMGITRMQGEPVFALGKHVISLLCKLKTCVHVPKGGMVASSLQTSDYWHRTARGSDTSVWILYGCICQYFQNSLAYN